MDDCFIIPKIHCLHRAQVCISTNKKIEQRRWPSLQTISRLTLVQTRYSSFRNQSGFSEFCSYSLKKNLDNKDLGFFANSQGNILFHSFLLNFIDTCKKTNSTDCTFMRVLNSQGNTACFVSVLIFKFMVETWHYNENPL